MPSSRSSLPKSSRSNCSGRRRARRWRFCSRHAGSASERRSRPIAFEDGVLRSADGSGVTADAVVALPKLEGQHLDGIPQDERGFVRTDEYGRVAGLTDVYAAGDLTQSSIKQGGIAAQEADAVAEAIAADAGAPVQPTPCRPVLRGLLFTGFVPRFLRHEEAGALARRHAAAVVAARQDRRPLPEPVPRRAPRAGGVVGGSPGGCATDRGRGRPPRLDPGLTELGAGGRP